MDAQKAPLENWNALRAAYHVARLGTLSAAAGFLGVHHATLIRHIDALEAHLGCKLFQRHARGYTPTEAGLELMQVVATTEERFAHLAGKLRGQGDALRGDLVVTCLAGLSPQITPLLVEFGRAHPEIRLTLLADERPLRLEYGEAHVALRAGNRPVEPDNVVQEVAAFPVSLFAHKDYVARYGLLLGEADIPNHRFVSGMTVNARAPFTRWLASRVPPLAIVYKASDIRAVEDAIHRGAGIGFLSLWSGKSSPDLVQMMPSLPEWGTRLWLVTHVDLHRSAKVGALVAFLKKNMQQRIETFG